MKLSMLAVLPVALCLLTSTALASPDFCGNESVAREDLKQSLLKTHGNSSSIVKMLLDDAMNDYKKLCSAPNSESSHGIIKGLSSNYYPNFSTIWMLYEEKYADYKALQ